MKRVSLVLAAWGGCLLWGGAALAQGAAPVVLKWAHGYEVTEPFHTQAETMAEKIRVATDKRVDVRVFPASKLGAEAEYTKKMAANEIDIAYVGLNVLARDYVPLGVVGFPFLFNDQDHVRRFLSSAVFDELRRDYEKTSKNNLAGAVYYGARHLTSNRPVRTPQDLAGLRLRVPDAPPYKLFAKGVGAVVTPMPFAKVYDALKSGEIDAQENPLPTILAKKFYEVQKNVTLTAHIHDLLGIVVSAEAMRRLSDADRAILLEVFRKDAIWASVQLIGRELIAEKTLADTGVTIIRPERQPFVEAVLAVVSPTDLQSRPGDYQRIRDLVRSGMRLVPAAK